MPRSKATRLFVCLTALALAALATSTAARAEAEDSAAVEKVTKLNKKAVDEYQNLNFEESRKLLKNAIEICGAVGPGEPPGHRAHLRPPRHRDVHGLQAEGRGDQAVPQGARDPGGHQAGQDPRHPGGAGGLRRGGRAAEGSAGTPKKPRAEAGGEGIDHEPVDQSPQGSPIPIKASVDPSLGAKKVVLSFSADGADDFAEKEMKEDPPGAAATPRRSRRRPRRAASSTTSSRRWATTKRRCGEGLREQDAEDHDAGRERAAAGPRRQGEEAAEEGRRATRRRACSSGWLRQRRRLDDRERRDQSARTRSIRPALSMSRLLHLAPEFGYYVSPELLLSVQLRLQLISGATEYRDPNADCECPTRSARRAATRSRALRGRRYFFGEEDFRTYVAGTLGLGTIRHVRLRLAAPLRHEHDDRPASTPFRQGRCLRAWAPAHVQREPDVRADVRHERAARFHQVHGPRRPERRRRARVLAPRARAARSFRVPRAARPRRTGARRGGS